MKKIIFACIAGVALTACGDKNPPPAHNTKSATATPQAKPETAANIPVSAEKPLATQDDLGVPKKEVAFCAADLNTVKRLECYDKLAVRHGQAPSEAITSTESKGKWITKTNTDPLTDKSVYIAFLEAESGKGRFGDSITLTVRCQNNTTESYINWNTFLGSDGISVTSRVDKNPAKTSHWGISTDHKASFMPNAAANLKSFIGSNTFIANLTPYSESPITAVFDISGAEQALSDISKGCSWKK